MKHSSFSATVLFLMMATTLIADEKGRNEPIKLPPNESVKWMPERNVKNAIVKEIDKFGREMKSKLGPKTLAFKPYIAVDDSPEAAALELTFRTSRGQYLANSSRSSRGSARVVFGGHVQQLEDFAMQRGEFGCQALGGFGSGCR